MDWIKEIPKEPGYYFIRAGKHGYASGRIIVKVVLDQDGPVYFTFHNLAPIDIWFEEFWWLGPIRAEDIIGI